VRSIQTLRGVSGPPTFGRREVKRFPHFLIDGGATGTITEATVSLIALRMDEFVPGAEDWDNELCWTSDDGDFCADTDATAEHRIAAALPRGRRNPR
jgi:hypothetical protein